MVEGNPKSIRVLALDCEIQIPGDYTVQTQDRGSVSFFSTRLDELSRIDIVQDVGGDELSTPYLRTIETRSAGHLKIARKEILDSHHHPLGVVVEIRSRGQRLYLFDDAKKLEAGIVASCLSSVRPEVARTYQRRAAGCAFELSLHPTYDFVFDSASFIPVFSDTAETIYWELADVAADGVLGRHGLRSGDRITSMCGVPLPEATAMGGPICCSSGTPDTLTLSAERPGAASVEVSIPKQN